MGARSAEKGCQNRKFCHNTPFYVTAKEYVNMYAIIEDGGKQYKVQQGDVVCVELRDLPAEQDSVEFDRVLFYRDGQTTLVGGPLVQGAKVVGKVNGQVKGPKLYSLKYRRRKDSRRRIGHRQGYLEVLITDIVKS